MPKANFFAVRNAIARRQAATRATWERIPLADAIEIHARRPMTREEQRQLEELLREAEQIFGPQPRGNS